MDFWSRVSRLIIKGRFAVLFLIAVATYLLGTQMKYMSISSTEANLLPQDHVVNVEYDQFLNLFGEEGNVIVMAVSDSTLFTPEKFNGWNALSKKINSYSEVDLAVSIGDIKRLKKNSKEKKFDTENLFSENPTTEEEVLKIKNDLFNNLPFFENLLYNKASGTICSVIYLNKEIVNTPARKEFIQEHFIPEIEAYEAKHNIDVRVSGMPYIRTLNSQNIVDEIGIFVGLAMFVTALIFFLFFRSWRATFITLLVVSIGDPALIWIPRKPASAKESNDKTLFRSSISSLVESP